MPPNSRRNQGHMPESWLHPLVAGTQSFWCSPMVGRGFLGMARVVVPSSHGEAEVTIQGARTRPSIVYGLN